MNEVTSSNPDHEPSISVVKRGDAKLMAAPATASFAQQEACCSCGLAGVFEKEQACPMCGRQTAGAGDGVVTLVIRQLSEQPIVEICVEPGTSVLHVRNTVAASLSCAAQLVQIVQDGQILPNERTLLELGFDSGHQGQLNAIQRTQFWEDGFYEAHNPTLGVYAEVRVEGYGFHWHGLNSQAGLDCDCNIETGDFPAKEHKRHREQAGLAKGEVSWSMHIVQWGRDYFLNADLDGKTLRWCTG